MKKFLALTLTLILTLAAATAFAADARVESVEYMGFGIVELDFTWDCDWYQNGTITLTDANGAELPVLIVGGEAENCYLRSTGITDGGACTVNFTLGGTTQSISFDAVTGTEYYVRNDDSVNPRQDNDRCDICRQPGHDEDYCPQRIDAASIPDDDADAIARMFDIDRCERCGGIGHDDDRCPNR